MVEYCNTPDVPTLFVFQLLPFPALSYFISSLSGFVSVCCCLCHASHIMSSCALHLHTCSSHASEHFPSCPFCIPVLLCPPMSLSTSFRVRVLNVFGLDRDFSCGIGLLPVDRLSSFVSFGLRLILQRLTERDRKGLVCVVAQHPSKVAQNPPKPPPSSRAFNHDRVGANRTSFGAS